MTAALVGACNPYAFGRSYSAAATVRCFTRMASYASRKGMLVDQGLACTASEPHNGAPWRCVNASHVPMECTEMRAIHS
jgi:hypothetical protein